ncbi:MAG: glycosyltransferase [Bdellovibrionota bacterium]
MISASFPVAGYGGTERVAYWLAKAQAERGHEVTVICNPGSNLPFARTLDIPENLSNLDTLLPPGTDVVQLYNTPSFSLKVPVLVNIGGNGQAGEHFHPNTVFVSRNHASRHGWTEFVHNGLDLDEYPLERRKENYLLFLAKASWRVKNLKGAIRIAKEAGRPLHVAGGNASCWHFGVKSFGIVGGQQKLKLLQSASALLFPVIWNEPFGIAVIEALACGTPVVATPRGGLPEIIDESCGVLADSYEGLVAGAKGTKKFTAEACRARVEAAFTHRHMAEKYETYYRKVISEGKLREGFPQAPPNADPQEKIYYRGYGPGANQENS